MNTDTKTWGEYGQQWAVFQGADQAAYLVRENIPVAGHCSDTWFESGPCEGIKTVLDYRTRFPKDAMMAEGEAAAFIAERPMPVRLGGRA